MHPSQAWKRQLAHVVGKRKARRMIFVVAAIGGFPDGLPPVSSATHTSIFPRTEAAMPDRARVNHPIESMHHEISSDLRDPLVFPGIFRSSFRVSECCPNGFHGLLEDYLPHLVHMLNFER